MTWRIPLFMKRKFAFRFSTFFMLWAAGESNTPMEQQLNNNHSFNLKQREIFAKLLVQAKEHAQTEQESDYAVDQRIEEEMLPKLAQERGASEWIEKVRTLRKELDEAKTALSQPGFSCSEDEISIDCDESSQNLREAVAAAKRSARK